MLLLEKELRPIPREKPERIRKLIGDLDADNLTVREAALRDLACLGPQTASALREAEKSVFETARSRAREVRENLDSFVVKDPETLRSLRAIWVLERIGSPDTRKLLEKMADGSPEARPTIAAKAALQRIAKPNATP